MYVHINTILFILIQSTDMLIWCQRIMGVSCNALYKCTILTYLLYLQEEYLACKKIHSNNSHRFSWADMWRTGLALYNETRDNRHRQGNTDTDIDREIQTERRYNFHFFSLTSLLLHRLLQVKLRPNGLQVKRLEIFYRPDAFLSPKQQCQRIKGAWGQREVDYVILD